jgi:hypothetical protein
LYHCFISLYISNESDRFESTLLVGIGFEDLSVPLKSTNSRGVESTECDCMYHVLWEFDKISTALSILRAVDNIEEINHFIQSVFWTIYKLSKIHDLQTCYHQCQTAQSVRLSFHTNRSYVSRYRSSSGNDNAEQSGCNDLLSDQLSFSLWQWSCSPAEAFQTNFSRSADTSKTFCLKYVLKSNYIIFVFLNCYEYSDWLGSER